MALNIVDDPRSPNHNSRSNTPIRAIVMHAILAYK